MHSGSSQFRYNRALLKLGAALATFMVVFGIFMTYAEWPEGADLLQGILIVVFSVGFLIWLAKVWSDRRVIVEVGSDGIYDRRLSDELIPWSTIVSIRGYGVWDNPWLRWLGTIGGLRGASNSFVGLMVKNPEKIYRPPNPVVKAVNRFVSWIFGYPLLSINMGPLDGTYADLVGAIQDFAVDKGIELRA